MALRRTMQNGGGGGFYSQPYIKPMAPSGYSIQRNGAIAPDVATLIDQPFMSEGLIDPAQYTGLYLLEDVLSAKPITCMRGNPNIQTFRALVCVPNKAEIERRKSLGLKTVVGVDRPIKEIVETTNGNGETVKVAIDENGDVAATKKAPNIVPVALAAAAAWFFLM